jgi:lipoprotein NlpI
VTLDGSTYFLDATRSHQSGELSRRQSVGFLQGLPLTAETTAPVPLPSAFDEVRVVARDVIRFERFQTDPTLEARITYRGDMAEGMREALANGSLADITTQLSTAYLKLYPKARAAGPVQVEPSTEDDAVTLVQHFTVPDFWRFPEHRQLLSPLVPYIVADALVFPASETRHLPMAYPFVGIVRHTVAVEFPEDVYGQPPAARFEDGDAHVALRETVQGTRRRVEFSSELHINRELVNPEEWSAYTAKVQELRRKIGYAVSLPTVPLEQADKVVRDIKDAAAHRRHVPGETDDDMARVKMVVLTAEINGGRLPPPLEAQARTERGQLNDNDGHPEIAADDFSRALQLAPDSVEVLSGAAINALESEQLDRAIELAGKALEQSSHYDEALVTRARARYLKKDLAGARADFEEALKDPAAVRRGYPLLWLEFTLRQGNQNVTAATAAYTDLPTDWPRPLIDLAASRAAPEAVIAAARARKKPAEALCEAYFFIGEDYYTRGNLEEARKSWQKATEQGVPGFVEDSAARLRLKSLPGK